MRHKQLKYGCSARRPALVICDRLRSSLRGWTRIFLLRGGDPGKHSSTSPPLQHLEIPRKRWRTLAGKRTFGLLCDWWMDRCMAGLCHDKLGVYAPFHLEVWSVLLVSLVTPLDELSTLKMVSMLLHPQRQNRLRAEMSAETKKLTMTHLVCCSLKGQFTLKSKIHIFSLTCSAIYQLNCFGLSCLVLDISAVEISAFSQI